MAEILLRVTDKTHQTEPNRVTKRGDIIVVQADGWPWSRAEQTLSFWRIIKLPNITVAQAKNAMLAAGTRTDPTESLITVPLRAFRLDLDTIISTPALVSVAAYLTDNTRTQPSFSVPWSLAQLNNFRKASR